MSRFCFCFSLVILAWSPVPLGSNRPWAWGLLAILIGINAILTSLFAYPKEKKQTLFYAVPLLGVLLLVQLYLLLQAYSGFHPELNLPIVSYEPGRTLVYLLRSLSLLLFVICLTLQLNTMQRIKSLVIAIIAIGACEALYAIFLQLSGVEQTPVFGLDVYNRANGSFVYHNHLANYLLLTVSMAIGYLIGSLSLQASSSDSSRVKIVGFLESLLSSKWVLRSVIIMMVTALILTRSRMGNSAFFISLLLISIASMVLYKKPPKMLKWLIVSLITLDVIIVGSMFGVEKVAERLESTSFQSETRDDVVEMSLPMVRDHALFGGGAGTFYTLFPNYHTYYMSGFYDFAHNDYLQFLVEYGLLPFSLLALLIFYCFYCAIQAIRKRHSNLLRGIGFGCAMAIVGMMMHMTVDFPLQCPANTLLFIVILQLSILSYRFKPGLS